MHIIPPTTNPPRELGARVRCTIFAIWSLIAAPYDVLAEEALEGRISDSSGRAVGGAEVELASSTQGASDPGLYGVQIDTTDARGRFAFASGVAYPCTLRVAHPWFDPFARVLPARPSTALTLALRPRVIPLLEEISVPGENPTAAPIAIASSVVEPSDKLHQPTALTEIIQGVPGVAENGQGGIFQVASVRGTSRERVLTMISDMRIVSERRAGVSTSFLDPMLMNSVEVLRGPSSSFYGSGSFGGVIHVHPRKLEGWSGAAGIESSGRENVQMLGWGGHGWSIAGARREAMDAEAPDGSTLYSNFHQYSGTIEKSWDTGNRRYEVLVAPSLAHDIGKANTDYPERTTQYPRERHLLSRFVLTAGAGTRILAYVHPNDLQTETEEAGEVAEVLNEAFDFGAGLARSFTWTEHLGGRLGVDYFGRRHVNAFESSHPSGGGPSTPEMATLRRGFQDELALYGAATRPISAVTVQGGVRGTWRRQGNEGWDDENDLAANAFAGAVAKVAEHVSVSGEVANGIRFPSLSERFFTGTTGAGGIIGNPDLEHERSTSLDLGCDVSGDRGRARVHGFSTWVDDYIERIEVQPDLFTFQNLVSGRITGLELEGRYDVTSDWTVNGYGQVIASEDGDGEVLADTPAHRFQMGVERRFARFATDASYEYRFEKDEPGPGEKPIGDAHLVTLRGRCDLGRGMAGTVSVANLLDETYFLAADSRAPLAPGRSVAIGISFQQ